MREAMPRRGPLWFSLVGLALLAPLARVEAQAAGGLDGAVSHRPRRALGAATAPDPQPTAEGEPEGEGVAAVIGPTGGVLATADGACEVTVPAGALAAPTQLTLQPITNLAWGGVGTAYRLGPPATEFAVPVTMTFRLPANESPASLEGLGIAEQDDQGYWRWIPDVERTTEPPAPLPGATSPEAAREADVSQDRMKVSAGSRRSGGKSVVAYLQLSPRWKLVERGQCIDYKFEVCYYVQTGGANEPIGGPCESVSGKAARGGTIQAQDWAVAGQIGGNSEYGTITGGASSATYCAPSERPRPASAWVTARVAEWKGTEADVKLTSEVFIDPPDFQTKSFHITMLQNPGSPIEVKLEFEGNVNLFFEKQNVLHDPGEAGTRQSYTTEGHLGLKSTSYTMGGFNCTCDSAVNQQIPQAETNYFHLWRPEEGGSQVNWVLEPLHWHFFCSVPGSPGGFGVSTTVTFGTLKGDGRCDEPVWVENSDRLFPSGNFRKTCHIGIVYDATWEFEPM